MDGLPAPEALPVIPDQPAALDAWLREHESRFDDLVPGTERRILWADPDSPAPTDVALVYLHGFSATHRETAPLTERVAEELGANAYLARLTGHGRSGEALGAATAREWVRDAAEAVAIGRTIGRRVVLIGVSTGGTLATLVAADERWNDELAALVLLSPNYRIRDPGARVLTWPWGGLIARLAVGKERAFEPHTEDQARFWTERYPTRVLTEMAALVKRVTSRDLRAVRTPTLVFYSPDDQIVDPAAVEEAFAAISADAKELVRVDDAEDPSSHVLAGDILSPGRTGKTAARSVEFVRRAVE